MKKIIFATKGWKSLQKDYVSEDIHAVLLQKLHAFLQRDISNYSFEEMTIHYGFISHAAMQTCIANYMQTGTVENAEYYLYLAARAKATSDNLWIANPHSQKYLSQGQEVQLDCKMTPDFAVTRPLRLICWIRRREPLNVSSNNPAKAGKIASRTRSGKSELYWKQIFIRTC